MSRAIVATCSIEFYLPGVNSLKEKRSIIKSMLSRLRNTFNVSAAEVDHLDVWQSSLIAVAVVSNSTSLNRKMLQNVVEWIETNFPEAMITKQEVEML